MEGPEKFMVEIMEVAGESDWGGGGDAADANKSEAGDACCSQFGSENTGG